ASPEQARGAPVTPASDIYSLGVLLFELLVGISPYRVTGGSAASFVHAISHEPPQRPSLAVAQLNPADPKAIAIAANRDTEPAGLRRKLAGDLDAILLTALDKEPGRRYNTVANFAADIRLHLAGSKVNARKLTRLLARQSVRKRGAIAAVLAAAACAAVLGVYYRNAARTQLNVRPSVAVLGFQNLSNESAAEWNDTAPTEMLSTELAAGGKLRTVPGELVSRVKLEMALPNPQTLTGPTLGRLRENLSADYVVFGSYLAIGEGTAAKLRLDLRLQDTGSGELLASVSDTRSLLELVNLVTNAGSVLRRQLNSGAAADSASVRGSVPDNAEA